MITSPAGIALIKSFEGLRLEAYQDQVGVWTIGYGSTRGVKAGDKITEGEAVARLVDDLQGAEAGVRRLVTATLTQPQFDALVSFVFNLGAPSLASSQLLRLLNSGKASLAADEFPRWVHAGGVVVEGLRRRRRAEQALFQGLRYNMHTD